MPFPLAHPAAVLPLRRFCPGRLSLAALMIGSLAPDTSYAFWRLRLNEFAHTALGSLGYCLPAGALLFLAFLAIRRPLVNALPAPHREALLPLSSLPAGSVFAVIPSLLLGIWTHLVLDSVTRESQTLMAHLPLFQEELADKRGPGVLVYRLLWYLLTVGGLAWLTVAYLRFLKRSTGAMSCFAPWEIRRYLAWGAILTLPSLVVLPSVLPHAQGWPQLYAVRQFFYVWSAHALVATGTTLAAVGLLLRAVQAIQLRPRVHRKRKSHSRQPGRGGRP